MRWKLALLLIGSLFMTSVFAGGLDAGTSAATEVKIWLYSLLGIIAFIYLMYMGLQGWMHKRPWADFGMAIVEVAAVGATVVIVPWAWNLFV